MTYLVLYINMIGIQSIMRHITVLFTFARLDHNRRDGEQFYSHTQRERERKRERERERERERKREKESTRERKKRREITTR